MEFDEVLVEIGEFGKYQKILYFILCLASAAVALNNMGIVFVAAIPKHWCATPELTLLNISRNVVKNLSIPVNSRKASYEQCFMYNVNYTGWSKEDTMDFLLQRNTSNLSTMKCRSGWIYDQSLYKSTIATEWDLVCDKQWLASMAAAMTPVGVIVGNLLFGGTSDRFGRRPTLYVTLVLTTACVIFTAFSPNISVYLVFRFVTGMCGVGFYTISFVMAIELVGPAWREFAGMVLMFFWAGGYLTVSAIAYAVRDWFTLQMLLASGMFICFIYFCLVPESIRWLYVNNRKEESEKMLRKIAKINGTILPENLEVITKSDQSSKANIIDLVRTPRLRRRSFMLFFIWCVNNLVYYGLSLNTGNLGGNPYLSSAISAAVEFPAYALCMILLKYTGRRISLSSTMVIGGAALLVTLAVPPQMNWLSITLAMVGKFCITASFAILYVFTAEIYPTVLRNLGIGASGVFSQLGGIAAPFIAQLSVNNMLIPLVLFGAMSMIGGLLGLLLPETKGKNLPESVYDAENFGIKSSLPEPKAKALDNPAFQQAENYM